MNQQILEKAIQKAMHYEWRGDLLGDIRWVSHDNGKIWELTNGDESWSFADMFFGNKAFIEALWGEGESKWSGKYLLVGTEKKTLTREQALKEGVSEWTIKLADEGMNVGPADDIGFKTFQRKYDHKKGWKHHLQQMVIAEDPIKYLGEHLNG